MSVADLKGKTIVLTGATSGIGLAAAHALARLGPSLVMVGRDPDKAEQARVAVTASSQNGRVSVMLADLSSLQSIRELGARLREAHPRLDVLVNNAGGMNTTRKTTVDGFELTFATNHLGYFLLTHELLPSLRASPSARIVNTASAAHRRGALDFGELQAEKRYSPMAVYGRSKLCNVLFTYELARRLGGSTITANCLHPGFVDTGFGKNDPGLFKYAVALAMKVAAISVDKGADTIVYLASSPEVEGVSGKYFVKRRPELSSPPSYDVEAQAKLWRISEELTGATSWPTAKAPDLGQTRA